MGFGGFGMGFLDTDPRKKKNPTGGSSKVGQPKDTSALNTGDPSDGGIGFGSADFSMSSTDPVAPAVPLTETKMTAGERVDSRVASGRAETGKNMGSLAVGFRESEQAKTAAGEQTVQGARDTKVLDARSADEHKRLVTDPAAAEMAKFRAQAASSKAYMNKSMMSIDAATAKGRANVQQRSNAGGGLIGGKRTPTGGAGGNPSTSGLMAAQRSGNLVGPTHGGILGAVQGEFEQIQKEGDPMAMAEQRAHGAAPGTMEQSWQDAADAQSASGKATPAEMAQAAVSMHARKTPNK